MKLRAGLLLLILTPVWAQVAPGRDPSTRKPRPAFPTPALAQIAKPAALTAPTAIAKPVRLPASTIRELEKAFDGRLLNIADGNEPVELMGDTRGLQLDGYGLVFTSELSLIVTPSISPFQSEIPKQLQARVHQRRIDRLPLLKAAMKEMLRSMAAAASQLPATQQMVLAVRLYYGAWEDTTGMPGHVILRANRANAATGNVETEER